MAFGAPNKNAENSPRVVNNPSETENTLSDPFENFKRGWDDVMLGHTMSFEEFERRMLEDAD